MKILASHPELEVEAAKKLIENLASSDKDVLSFMAYTVGERNRNDSLARSLFDLVPPAVNVASPEKIIAA
jgi:hypothetical protein